MSKIDQKFSFNGGTTEMHIGGTSGDSGSNASGPADAPNQTHPRVVVSKVLNVATPLGTRIANPA